VYLVVHFDDSEENIKYRDCGVLEGERQTDRQRAHSERRLEDFLPVGMGHGPTYYVK
jgi:hypothetical protein